MLKDPGSSWLVHPPFIGSTACSVPVEDGLVFHQLEMCNIRVTSPQWLKMRIKEVAATLIFFIFNSAIQHTHTTPHTTTYRHKHKPIQHDQQDL